MCRQRVGFQHYNNNYALNNALKFPLLRQSYILTSGADPGRLFVTSKALSKIEMLF